MISGSLLLIRITQVGAFLASLSTVLQSVADQVRDYPVIGDWLASGFEAMKYRVDNVRVQVGLLGGEVMTLVNAVNAALGSNALLGSLVTYVSLIIEFFTNPVGFIVTRIYLLYPLLLGLFEDPGAWLRGIITAFTGISTSFINDPVQFVKTLINNALRGFGGITALSWSMVVNALATQYPFIRQFLSDPRNYILNKLYAEFPDLRDFAKDPKTYIANKLLDAIEFTLDKYGDRIVKIATALLVKIW